MIVRAPIDVFVYDTNNLRYVCGLYFIFHIFGCSCSSYFIFQIFARCNCNLIGNALN